MRTDNVNIRHEYMRDQVHTNDALDLRRYYFILYKLFTKLFEYAILPQSLKIMDGKNGLYEFFSFQRKNRL